MFDSVQRMGRYLCNNTDGHLSRVLQPGILRQDTDNGMGESYNNYITNFKMIQHNDIGLDIWVMCALYSCQV